MRAVHHPSRESFPGRLTWRVIFHDALPGADNMAIDHALAESLAPGQAVLRLYRWCEPTVSFGRNEAARGRYDGDRGRDRGIAFVRRPTGGRAVLHDRELTYAAVLPLRTLGGLGGLRAAYRWVNLALLAGLERLGVAAHLAAGDGPAPRQEGAAPCFFAPAPGELVVEGRKLVGSAQGRVGGALLQHGSLLLDGGQEEILALCGACGRERIRATTLAELLGRAPAWETVADAVLAGFRATFEGEWRVGGLTARETALAEMHRERYASPEWTWRR